MDSQAMSVDFMLYDPLSLASDRELGMTEVTRRLLNFHPLIQCLFESGPRLQQFASSRLDLCSSSAFTQCIKCDSTTSYHSVCRCHLCTDAFQDCLKSAPIPEQLYI